MLITNLFSSVQTLLPLKQKTFRIKLDKINKHRIRFIFMSSRRLQMTKSGQILMFFNMKKNSKLNGIKFHDRELNSIHNNQIGNLMLEIQCLNT